MRTGQSSDYFQRRAEEERVAAESAVDERAAQSHRELSHRYHNLANGSEHLSRSDADATGDGILANDFRILP